MAPDTLKHGLTLSFVAEPSDIVDYAVRAEESGWDGVFLIDHLSDYSATRPDGVTPINDPWITWAGVATQTSDLTLGSSITPVPRRQPWQLARNLATLDRLSDGRVCLGAGLGAPMEFTPFGQNYDQSKLASRYEEALDVMTGLWTGERFSYDGDHFTIDDVVMRPTPVQEPRIPIIIGGWWPFKGPFRRGARYEGIIPNWPSLHCDAPYVDEMPEHMREIIPEEPAHETEIREMLRYYRDLTDNPGEVILLGGDNIVTGDFLEECRDMGVTWLIHNRLQLSESKAANLERIEAGPEANLD